jgi:PRTRC genetic system protein A
MNKLPLETPVYLKDSSFVWPEEDKIFYLLSRNGLFLCRNHPWFRSCVRCPENRGPSELEPHTASFASRYPIIPQALLEQAVGFFLRVHQEHGWEAGLILVWNRTTHQMELVCPEQKNDWSTCQYTIPALPPHLLILGDLHSHGNMGAFASGTDTDDETNRPGIHIVVGHITDEIPSFHAEIVADSTRFRLDDLDQVMEEYQSCDPAAVPPEWLQRVTRYRYTYSGRGYYSYTGEGGGDERVYGYPDKKDQAIIQEILKGFARRKKCSPADFIRQRLWQETKVTSYDYCLSEANKFVQNWEKREEIYAQ